MGIQFTLDGGEADALIAELVSLTGRPAEELLLEGAKLRLVEARKERKRQEKIAAILRIGDRVSAQMTPGTTSDHSWLYDENGFPA